MQPDNQPKSQDDVVRDIMRRQSQMEARRVNFESQWLEIAQRVLPRSDIFFRGTANGIIPGEKRTEKIFDSTGQNALPRFAAAMESLLTPRTQRWHKLEPYSRQLRENPSVQRYCDEVTEVLFDARYSPRANYASQAYENYMSLGAFGTAAMFIDEITGISMRYKAVHLAELFFSENHQGIIDTVHRKYPMSARQCMQKWGIDKLPQTMKAALETDVEREFDILHCVYPREEVQTGRKDYRGMAWASYYISITDKLILEEGGYNSFPYAVGRYVTGPREIYGRSPAMQALPDIKSSQQIRKTLLRAGEMAVEPPILLPEDGALQGFDVRSGALNWGMVDDHGQVLAHPFQSGVNLPTGFDIEERVHKDINDAFAADLWRMLTEHPDMTATQALMIAQQQGMLYAPMMGRQQSETLGPQIMRELDILWRADQLPPMPPELLQAGGLRIEYSSPLNRLQKADDGVGILNTINALTPIAQIDPGVFDTFNFEEVARVLAEVNGVPAKVLRTPEEMQAVQQQKAQQQQLAQLVQAAPVASGVIKDLSQAQATAQNTPQPQTGMGG